MRKLGKFGCAVVLGCLLSLALLSTGAFAQSAGANTARHVAVAHISRGAQTANGWGNGRVVRVVRWVRETRLVRETRFVRVVRVIRQVRVVSVTRLIRVVRFVRVGCGARC